jgi:hypothetical protein
MRARLGLEAWEWRFALHWSFEFKIPHSAKLILGFEFEMFGTCDKWHGVSSTLMSSNISVLNISSTASRWILDCALLTLAIWDIKRAHSAPIFFSYINPRLNQWVHDELRKPKGSDCLKSYFECWLLREDQKVVNIHHYNLRTKTLKLNFNIKQETRKEPHTIRSIR